MTPMQLTYRLYQEQDSPGLLRLWEQETGWGTPRPELRQWLFEGNPYEGTFIVVAMDESQQIVGEFIFFASLVSVDGREVRASRAFAPIVSKVVRDSYRSINPFQPISAMYQLGVQVLQERGDELIYMVPNPRWMRFLRMFPGLHCGSFPLWSLPLPLTDPLLLGDGFTSRPLAAWDERVDRLWQAASRLHGCMAVRDARTLSWKVGNSHYDVTAVERGGEMVGLVASRKKGDRQWLIFDLLSADAEDSLRATLAAVCNLAHAKWAATDPEETEFRLRKVAVLVTPVMERAVRSLGFTRDDYDFPLAINILDPKIAEQDVMPARWYISAND